MIAAVILVEFAAIIVVSIFFITFGNPNKMLGLPTTPPYSIATQIVVFVIMLTLGPGVLFQSYHSFFESHILAITETIRAFLQVISVAITIYYGGQLIACVSVYYLIYIPFTLFYLTLFFYRRKWRFPIFWKNFTKKIKSIYLIAKPLLYTSGLFGFLQIGALINGNIDTIIITHVLTAKDVAHYNVLQRIFMAAIGLHVTFLQGYWGIYSLKYQEGDLPWLRSIFARIGAITLLLWAISAFFVMLLGSSIIRLWTGFVITNWHLYAAFCAWGLFLGLSNHMSVMLNAIGRPKRQAIMLLIGALINIPLATLLGEKIGLIGILLGTSAPLLLSLCSNSIELFQVIGISPRRR